MTTRFYEFLHVSEMLETVFGLSVSLLLITEFFLARNELWNDVAAVREQEGEEEEKWFESQIVRRGINTTVEPTEAENSMVRNVQEELNPPHPQDNEGEMVPAPVMQQAQVQSIPQQIKKPTDRYEGLTDSKRQSMQMHEEINEVFNRFVPVIMCCMVLAILTESTFIMSAICFFCFIFFNLVFNYAKLVEKLQMKIENKAIPLVLELMAGCFIIAFFVGIFIRTQFLA